MCINDDLREKLDSMSPDEIVQLYQDLKDLPEGVCSDQDDSHYVITNGSTFLTEFELVGRFYRYVFSRKGAVIFYNESEASMVLALLNHLFGFKDGDDVPYCTVLKLTKVKVHVKSKSQSQK